MPTDDAWRTWQEMNRRQRLAQLLLVLSEATETGAPTPETFTAVEEGVGAFHGPPFLGSQLPNRPRLAREFNAALRGRGRQAFGAEPLIGANAESGIAYSIGVGGTDVPYAQVLGEQSLAASRAAGRQVGADLRDHGYDWCFQPVVDVRVSTADPVIGVRAFGADPDQVGAHGAAFVHGVQSTGVWACAKHFPGHGDATVDSHLGLPTVYRTPADHDTIHLAPFRDVIAAGVMSIMTAHVVLPEQAAAEIATFSPELATGTLRDELGFDGVLVSDSLRMQAVSSRYNKPEAVLRSLLAGNDIVNIKCPPGEVPSLLDALVAAAESGRVADERLFEAFNRRFRARGDMDSRADGKFRGALARSNRAQQTVTSARLHDPGRRAPVQISAGGVVTVAMEPRPGDTEPPDHALAHIGEHMGITFELSSEAISGTAAHVVLCRGQAGLTDHEHELVAKAEHAQVPAGVFLGGPRATAASLRTTLPTVSAPCIDVFAIFSRVTAIEGFTALLEVTP